MARVGAAALVALAGWAAAALWTQPVTAACASICSTDVIYGFLPGGSTGCTCTGSSATDDCQCGVCYNKQSDGTVLAYAISSDGTCAFGTDCTGCTSSSSSSDLSSASGSSSTSTGSSSSSASHSGDGSAGSGDAGASAGSSSTTAGSSSSTSDSGGMETWQIALIICSAVLAFGVAVVSILTCYCKARRRLQETEEDEEVGYYHHPPRSGSAGSNLADAGLTAALMPGQRPSSNHSQHGPWSGSSLKHSPPMDVEPAMSTYSSSYDANTDRIGVGLPGRRSNGSNGDLAGSFNADRRPSQSSYSVGRRPSEEVYYTSRDRDAMAVEL